MISCLCRAVAINHVVCQLQPEGHDLSEEQTCCKLIWIRIQREGPGASASLRLRVWREALCASSFSRFEKASESALPIPHMRVC